MKYLPKLSLQCLNLTNMLGLYIHIPFCSSKCDYCDFVSFGGRENFLPLYLTALKNEAKKYQGEKINTVFIGGGTPSLMNETQIEDLCAFLHQNFVISKDAEFTIECNPASVTVNKLKTYKALGINRISIGAQSLSDSVLKSIGRCHNLQQLISAVENVKAVGFENFNLDLIFALPGQTVSQWKNTLQKALELEPTHISCYSLIVDENTPLGKEYAKGNVILPTEDEERKMYWLTRDMLLEKGIYQYEISNFARKGHECKHNVNYWCCGEYIGLGCSAHSYFMGERYYNSCDLNEYIAQKDIVKERQKLSPKDREEEKIIFSLRMNKGLDIKDFEKTFNCNFFKKYKKAIEKNLAYGFIQRENKFLRLTDTGRDFCDSVALEFIE